MTREDENSKLRYEKTLSNIQEVQARSGRVIAVVNEGDETVRQFTEDVLEIPVSNELLLPILEIVPLQIVGVSHRRVARVRRGSASEPGEVGDRRIDVRSFGGRLCAKTLRRGFVAPASIALLATAMLTLAWRRR